MRVLTPTLPGWNEAPRPTGIDTIGDYAVALLGQLTADGLQRANIATMSEVAGDVVDPGLRGKLAGVTFLVRTGIDGLAHGRTADLPGLPNR